MKMVAGTARSMGLTVEGAAPFPQLIHWFTLFKNFAMAITKKEKL
jgi:hypothetical protein